MSGPQHLLHVFATFCPAGPQVRTVALMHGFGDRFRHSVIACDGRTEASALIDPGIRVDYPDWAASGGPVGGMRGFRGLLRQQSPDLLLTYNWGAMDAVLAARSYGFRRHVHHEDGFNSDEVESLKARRNWARRIGLRSTDIIVPSSKLEAIARRTWRLPRVNLIPNGVDADALARDTAAGSRFREQHGIPIGAFVIGTVGHLRPVKNFGRLIRAAAAVHLEGDARPHLVLVGDGPERASLERTAAEHAGAVEVHFAGHLRELRPAYSAFDVFALSSDSEQQPVSLLEAMSAGVSVAATDVGDISKTLPPEARVHVVPLSASADTNLAAALGALARDPRKRARLAELGLARVRASFSVTAMIDAYGKVFETALGR